MVRIIVLILMSTEVVKSSDLFFFSKSQAMPLNSAETNVHPHLTYYRRNPCKKL